MLPEDLLKYHWLGDNYRVQVQKPFPEALEDHLLSFVFYIPLGWCLVCSWRNLTRLESNPARSILPLAVNGSSRTSSNTLWTM
jgi:hypothetical protein